MNNTDGIIRISVEHEKNTDKETGLRRMEAYFNAMNAKGETHHAEN